MKSVYSLVIGVVLVTASGLAVANEYLPYQESGYIILADGSDSTESDKPEKPPEKSESKKESSSSSHESTFDKASKKVREIMNNDSYKADKPKKPAVAMGVRG